MGASPTACGAVAPRRCCARRINCACQTIRSQDWKLSVYPTAHPACSQFFDLKNDPWESRNRFHDADCQQIRDAMLWRLLKRIHDNRDPLPLRLTQW